MVTAALPIPLVDLGAMHRRYADEIDAAMRAVVAETSFVGGRFVDAFEAEFAAYCGTTEAVGVANGTAAIQLALWAAGVGPGDEVITASHTFVATAEAIEAVGARTVLVDIDARSLTISTEAVAAAITARTAAIVPVHLYGQPADMAGIGALASRHGLAVVEDASQAHGARYDDHRVGGLGLAGCFSCYPGKNLGAYGDAGVVTTSEPGLAQRIRKLRDHGRSGKYEHDVVGCNERLDGLQAAVLSAKLVHLDEDNQRRARLAERYCDLLRGMAVALPEVQAHAEHVWHLYVVRVDRRDDVLSALRQAGIGAAIHYPIPVHLQPGYAYLGYTRGEFPVTEGVVGSILSLPMYPDLSEEQQDRVVATLATAICSPPARN